ncbi:MULTISPECIES: hypothetical protein [Lactiplantibacillus]|uniref:Integral membrane protein n=1 Tax=Lactiplantibacillus xiangfangensis TaxID=942150 RepID=A0A0R2MKS9_9LACO|nr:hypothetical protein [Lactiplantibacillus xiangfangensis]KRO14334.1 hypothetical protein IV64_GL001624 [Lactiplantibacillus xiangfangensis]
MPQLPEWVLRWSQSALTFIVVLTLVSVFLLQIPLKETILVDFAYMLLTLPAAWYREHHKA